MGNGPTLSAQIDPDVFLKLGDLNKASKGCAAGLRDVERQALKTGANITELSAKASRFEQVDAEIKRQLAVQEDALKRSEVFVRAQTNMKRLAEGEYAATVRAESKIGKLAKGGLVNAAITGAATSPREFVGAFVRAGGNQFVNDLLGGSVGGVIALRLIETAVEKGFEAYKKVQEYKKFEGDYTNRLAHGNVSEGEQLAHDSQFADKWWRKFGLDPEEAVKTVKAGADAVAGFKAGDQFNVIDKSLRQVGRKIGFGEGFQEILKGDVTFSNEVRKQTEKTISRGIEITPEIQARIRKEAVEFLLGSLYSSGHDKQANQLKDALEKNAKDAMAKQHRDRSPYEKEKDELKHRNEEFMVNTFKQEHWHRWRDFKVPANFRD